MHMNELPIFDACRAGDLTRCTQILNVNSEHANARNEYSRTPLHCASHGRHARICALLIAHGADVDARDWFGQTPLHKAVLVVAATGNHGDSSAVCSVLIGNGANINARDNANQTPMHLAPLDMVVKI